METTIKFEISDKVQAILDNMTKEEKVSLLHGANGDPYCANQAGYIPGIPRLGIPEVFLVDGETGINTSWDATMLPSKVGMGASFDIEAVEEYGRILGEEARASGVHIVLAPRLLLPRDCVAQFNTSNGGNYQTYGEDPVLIGELAAAEIKGIQEDNHAIATAKQFVASSTGTAQGAGNSVVDKQTLMEVYVKPFERAVQAGVGAVMTSYNQVNGIWSYRNPMLHVDILRNLWGFTGIAMNDWFCHYDTDALHTGVTLEMPGKDMYGEGHGKSNYGTALLKAAENPDSPITWEDIDRAVGYYIETLHRFGFLDTGRHPGAMTEERKQKSIPVARRLAAKTGVLLKNDGILPIRKNTNEKILFVGPTAQKICCPVFKEGAYGFKDRKIGPLQAMEEETGRLIDFAVGEDLDGRVIPAEYIYTSKTGYEHGFRRSYFPIEDKLEKKCKIYELPKAEKVYDKVDYVIDFQGEHALDQLNPAGEQGVYYYMWEGAVEAPEDGWYRLGVQYYVPSQKEFEENIRSNKDMDVGLSATLNIMKDGTDYYERIASGPRLAYNGGAAPISTVVPCRDGFDNVGDYVYMKKGNRYPMFITITALYYQKPQIRLCWVTPSMMDENLEMVREKSREADKVVVFAWKSSPSGDIVLNDHQESVLRTAYENNENVVVVLNSGGPVTMPWKENVKAILEMWYPGQEGARATIDLLVGNVNPSGKLPLTFPKRIEDMPTHDPRFPERYADQGKIHGVDVVQPNVAYFTEGIHVGYRWFDAEDIEPEYEFGYGMSYTEFKYEELETVRVSGGVNVRVKLKNIGEMKGAEVVQIYLTCPDDMKESIKEYPSYICKDRHLKDIPIQVSKKQLAGFAKVELEPGEEKWVEMHIDDREFSYFHVESESNRLEANEGWRLLRGRRELLVGASSRDIRLRKNIDIG